MLIYQMLMEFSQLARQRLALEDYQLVQLHNDQLRQLLEVIDLIRQIHRQKFITVKFGSLFKVILWEQSFFKRHLVDQRHY
jgi:hypothetical protein